MAKKEKEINPLWGGRFETGTDDLAQSFSASIDIDKRLFEVDIQGSIAYAEILKLEKCLIWIAKTILFSYQKDDLLT